MKLFKRFLQLAIVAFVVYSSVRSYQYFFYSDAPSIELTGVDQGGYYAQTVSCRLHGNDSFKIHCASIFLDGKPLLEKNKINAASFEHPFVIETTKLADGKHTLTYEVDNAVYHKKTVKKDIEFFVDNTPLHAALIAADSEIKIYQGRTLHIKVRSNKPLKQAIASAFGKEFVCFPELDNSCMYECFIPVACEEQAKDHFAHIDLVDLVGNTLKLDTSFTVVQYPFKRRQLVVDSEKVKQEKALGLSNEQLEQELQVLAQNSPQKKLWRGVFFAPTDIQGISSEFGSIRVTKEKGRYMHKAVDILNKPRSVIWAPQDGVVVLKDRYALSGNTVVIDHGYGILSLFYHLDDFAENLFPGMEIKRGNPIGLLGKTGYASGYHLHWEMRIGNIPVDPLQWTETVFVE